jgi:hypothetical protein
LQNAIRAFSENPLSMLVSSVQRIVQPTRAVRAVNRCTAERRDELGSFQLTDLHALPQPGIAFSIA